MDLHDYKDVAENYDLYLDVMYREHDNYEGFKDFYLDLAREYGAGGVIVGKIIRHERPDGIIPGIGGQTGLTPEQKDFAWHQ